MISAEAFLPDITTCGSTQHNFPPDTKHKPSQYAGLGEMTPSNALNVALTTPFPQHWKTLHINRLSTLNETFPNKIADARSLDYMKKRRKVKTKNSATNSMCRSQLDCAISRGDLHHYPF